MNRPAMPHTYTTKAIVLAALAVAVTVGCSRSEQRVDESMQLAQIALENGQLEVAEEYAEEAYEARADDSSIRQLAADVHRSLAERASKKGEFQSASASYVAAAEREPFRKQRSEDWYDAWTHGRDAGLDLEEISGYLQSSLEDDPSNMEVRQVAASAFDESGDVQSAIEQYLWVWEADRSQSQIGLRLGSLYAQAGETDDAIAVFRRVIDAEPKNVQAHLQLADLYEELGRAGRARSLYQQLVKEYPDNPAVLFRYADFLDRSGRNDEAARVRARAKGELPGIERRKMRRLR